jgi:hypothetical protein
MNDDQETEPTGQLHDGVLQEEPEAELSLPAVPVSVEGPVQVHQLASVAGASLNRNCLLAEGAVLILSKDDRRRIARVICGQILAIASDQATVNQGVAALWPANVPCEITHREEIWVKPAADAAVSVMVEAWAE